MKEAAGEANLTVVAIVLIGIIALIATPLIRNLVLNAKERACCLSAGGVFQGSTCQPTEGYSQAQYDSCMAD